MSYASIALSQEFLSRTEQVSALTAHLVGKGYRVCIPNNPEWLDLPELREAMRVSGVGQLYFLTLVNAKEEHYCSVEVWMTDGGKRPVVPPEGRLEVYLHLGYNETTARIDIHLSSTCQGNVEHVSAHLRTTVEDVLEIRIPWVGG